MANTEIFKTVFKGYSKEEVVSYIDNLNRQMSAIQNALDIANARVVQLEEEQRESVVDEESACVDEAEIREKIKDELIAAVRAQLYAEIEGEIRPQIEKEARRKVEEEMALKYEEIARAEINHRVQAQSAEVQELRRKAQLYDDNREVFAELMIKAKNDATGIIKDAEAHAKKLREDADHRYGLLMSDYEVLKSNLFMAKDEAADKLNFAMRSLEDFEKKFQCMDRDIALSKDHLEE